ncbi:MAG: helix-turn-helix domain-containing protein [Opitutaceae bacterium]|nr:helix-turn-helix domain-containing protein [Opitutaceae bacterium]
MPLTFDSDDAPEEKADACRRWLDALPLDTHFRQKELASPPARGADAGDDHDNAHAAAGDGGLAVLFRKLAGMSPKRYFDRRRMTFCHRQLADPLVPVKTIAIDLGFRRLSDFSEWVTLRFGAPPRRCRELLLAKKTLPKYPL